MRTYIVSFIFFAAALVPSFAFASCSPDGATIVYVNGIETTRQQADDDTTLLGNKFLQYRGSSDVQIITGYNPIHLDGYGDELESISQALNMPISDYDLDTILGQLAPEVTTQKLLLVGHSQGTFYTNEMYEYLTKNGVSPGSIAVYNIATPASFVAGGGNYLTSSNDKAINYVRQMDAQWGAPEALPANITIPQEPGYANDEWGGHYPAVYLDGAPERIVSDVKSALGSLSATVSTSSSCFAPPSQGISYAVQKAAFAIADPTVAGIDFAATDARTTVASVMNNANDIIHTALADAVFTIIPKPTADNAGAVFSVEKALYGSSMSVADYEALLHGQDIPEVEPPAPQEQTASAEVQKTPAKAAAPQSAEQATTSQIQEQTTSSTAGTGIPPTSEPVFAGTSISPGFGGGSPPQQPEAVAAQQIQQVNAAASSSSDAPETDAASSTAAIATASATSSLPSTQPSGDAATSSPPAVAAATNSLDASPVVDSFDAGFFDWNYYPSGYPSNWTTSSWDTATSDCYVGNCLSETVYDRQYDNIKIGTALDSGSFVIYFRNYQYDGSFGVGVCTENTSTECASPISVGGASALIFQIIDDYRDDAWHYIYFAFRDGATSKEYCGLVDNDDPADCSWQASAIPDGRTYSGAIFFTENGLNSDSSFYWDELGTGPVSPSGP